MINSIKNTKLEKGFVQIYTGNGKGKTTAAFGLAVRAAAYGFNVFIGQFLKGIDYSELKITEFTNGKVEVKQFGTKSLVHTITETDKILAKKGFELCKEKLNSENYDIVILDEINIAIYFKLLTVEEVCEIVKNKPSNVELVLTGRYANEKLIDLADLVTEMKEVKHYYTKGIEARGGIEK